MIRLFAFVPRIQNKWLRRAFMIPVFPFAVVEAAINGVIAMVFGYCFWWSFDYPTETKNV